MAGGPRPSDAAGVGPSDPTEAEPSTPGTEAAASPTPTEEPTPTEAATTAPTQPQTVAPTQAAPTQPATVAPIPAASASAATPTSAAAPPQPANVVPPWTAPSTAAQPVPPAVAAAEAAARAAAAQMALRGRAWWGQLDPTGKRPTLIVAAVLIVLVIGSQFINALVPVSAGADSGLPGDIGGQPAGGAPVDIGNGIRVTPPAGWVAVGAPVGLPGVRFQRGAITVEVGIAAFSASPRDLLLAYVNSVFAPVVQDVKVSTVSTGVAGNGRPTARATYAASFKDFGTAVEGELSGQVSPNGIGIVVNGYGPQGQLAGSLDDVHAFVDTIEVGQ